MPGNRWSMLALMLIARVSMALQFQSIGPVAPLLVADLALGYTQIGLLIGLYMLPGAVLALPGGMLGHRYGNRRMALCALGLMVGGGLATAASHSFWFACAGRTVSGAGAVLLTLIVTKSTAEWFAHKEISTAMSLVLATWPLGIGLGAASFGAVAARSSWRAVQLLAAASCAVALILLALLYRDAPGSGRSSVALRFWPRLSARGWALALAAGAVWALFNVGFIVLVGFGPALLVAQGASLGEAGLLMSLVLWVSVISVPVGGALTDRMGRPHLSIALGCGAMALAIAALPFLPGTAVWLVAVGLMLGLPAGAIVALVPGSVRPDHLGAALGIFFATYYFGMAAMQPVAGLALDLTGSPAGPVVFAAAMLALAVVALGAFRWIGREPRHDRAG